MRPRLHVPLTEEDCDIWVDLGMQDLWCGCFVLEDTSIESDRRDADLMLMAQQIASFGPCGIELHGIACRGWDQPENGKLRWLK